VAALGRLDENLLVVLLGEVVVEQAVRLARLPDVVVVVGRLLHADGVADDEGDRNEGQPAPDRLLAVLGAPPPRTRRERVRVHATKGRPAWSPAPAGTLQCAFGG
jgi:hypothetical protein